MPKRFRTNSVGKGIGKKQKIADDVKPKPYKQPDAVDIRKTIEDFCHHDEQHQLKRRQLAQNKTDRAFVKLKLGDFSSALRDTESALQIEPSNFTAHLRTAMAYIGMKNKSMAMRHLEVCLKMSPNNEDLLLLVKQTKTKKDVVNQIEKIDQIDVRREVKQFLNRREPERLSLKERAAIYTEKAFANLKLNRAHLALDDISQALLYDATNFKANFFQAICLLKLKRVYDSIEKLEKCIEIFGSNADMCRLLDKIRTDAHSQSIERLPNDLLVLIIQKLPFQDRMNAELVSKRWNSLAKNHGWTNFHHFSALQVDEHRCIYNDICLIKDPKKKFVPVFQRCGQFLRELSLKNFRLCKSVWTDIASKLVNLQHLDTGDLRLSDSILITIAGIPQLKSLALSKLEIHSSGGLNVLLKSCTQLRCLVLRGCANDFIHHAFEEVPPSLTYLEVDETVCYQRLLNRISEIGCPLESLIVSGGIDTMNGASLGSIPSLKYISVGFIDFSVHDFLRAFNDLSSLRALNLNMVLAVTELEEILNFLVRNCQQLEHMELECLGPVPVNVWNNLATGFPHLNSIKIEGISDDTEESQLAMQKTFREISSRGELKEFLTTTHGLLVKDVCKAVELCRNLNKISWPCELFETDWKPLFNTLDQINAAAEDRRVVHIYGVDNCHEYCCSTPIPEHPYVRFHDGLFESDVRNQHRFGCLSNNKPTFLSYFDLIDEL